ncbi:MAG: hypothetical protein RL645_1297, partial [Actinomycetota bacterium]
MPDKASPTNEQNAAGKGKPTPPRTVQE